MCAPLWSEARFDAKMHKTPMSEHFWKLRCRKSTRPCGAKHISHWKGRTFLLRNTLGSWGAQKVHAVVVRSTCRSQNVKNAAGSEHFWKLKYAKTAPGCGAKYVWTLKLFILRALLEVEMSKKCTPLWQSTFASQNGKRITCSHRFWTFNRHSSWQAQWILHLHKIELNVWAL